MNEKHKEGFLLGMDDYQRGHKTNPFPYGRRRRAWDKGFKATEEAVARARAIEQSKGKTP